MCVPMSEWTAPTSPAECITFRTIRRALRELRRCGFLTPACHVTPQPLARVAYVVAQLRARDHVDCDKAADFILELFTGQAADRRDDHA